MDMNKDRGSGVITIEAAIVMPLVIVTIVAVLYFMKVMFVQEQIHSAMVRTAHDMATYSTIADKTEIVDLQQEIFYAGVERMGQLETSIYDVQNQAVTIQANVKGVTDLSMTTIDMFKGFGSSSSIKENDKAMSLEDVIAHSKLLYETVPTQIETLYSDVNQFVGSIQSLMEEAMAGLVSLGAMELIEYVNGVLSTEITQARFRSYISDEQLTEWGVTSDSGRIDFTESHYMVEDDCIVIVARYTVSTPLISRFYQGVPIYQSVRVRGFTGAYDYDSQKRSFPKQEPIEDDEDIYYVSNKEGVQCYHVYTCLNKVLKSGQYTDRTLKHNQTVCSYCEDHYSLASSGIVYYVSDTSKLHYSRECAKVSSSDIRAVTKEEAEAQGYRMCKKQGCTHELLGQESEEGDE